MAHAVLVPKISFRILILHFASIESDRNGHAPFETSGRTFTPLRFFIPPVKQPVCMVLNDACCDVEVMVILTCKDR